MIIAIIYMALGYWATGVTTHANKIWDRRAVFRAFVLGIYIWMGIDSGCDHQNHIFQPMTWM